MTDTNERRNTTGTERDLFQLMKLDANGIRNIHEIKQFFKRRLSPRLFDINCHDEHGLTPLMIASDVYGGMPAYFEVSVESELNQTEIILILLLQGADVNYNILGRTALHCACKRSSSNVVKLLLSHGANPGFTNDEDVTPLMHLSARAEYDSMKALLECGIDINLYDSDHGDVAPIHLVFFASRNNPYRDVIRCVKLLLEYGANINLQDPNGATPLFFAVHLYGRMDLDEESALDFIRFLLNANADFNIQMTDAISICMDDNCVGDTPLHDAVRYEKVKVVQLLLEYHPNLSIRNSEGETALDLAKELQFSAIIQLIEQEHRHQIYKYLMTQCF